MKDKSQNKVETKNENEQNQKGFFKKVWYSIYKIEKYAELSAEGLGNAIKYLAMLILIFATISAAISVYNTITKVNDIAQYINDKIPEISYKEEILNVESQEPIIDENSEFGKIIIDTNTTDEEKINQYINESNDKENVVIVLRDKLILKESGIQGTVNYNYKDLLGKMGINEFNKQQLVEYMQSSSMINMYINLFVSMILYAFVLYFINSIFYVIVISIVGYLATIILKLKIRYVAVFNMAVYAITLPTLLNMIYLLISAFCNFTIKYFDVMYAMVASIYMIASVFILKSDFNKKQAEVQKIVEVEEEVKKEIKKQEEDKKQEEQQKEDKKEKDSDEKKDESKKEENNENGGKVEGSNA